MNSVTVPDPDGTALNCPHGCGMTTVLADLGDGKLSRVHGGTYRAQCPGRTAPVIAAKWVDFARPVAA